MLAAPCVSFCVLCTCTVSYALCLPCVSPFASVTGCLRGAGGKTCECCFAVRRDLVFWKENSLHLTSDWDPLYRQLFAVVWEFLAHTIHTQVNHQASVTTDTVCILESITLDWKSHQLLTCFQFETIWMRYIENHAGTNVGYFKEEFSFQGLLGLRVERWKSRRVSKTVWVDGPGSLLHVFPAAEEATTK